MKKIIKISAFGTAFTLVVIQLIPRDHNDSMTIPVNSISKVFAIGDRVNGIFKRSCYDCHSNHTEYPWYANLQPIRSILDHHIRGGKTELNFDEFATYTARKQRNKLRAVVESLEEGSMPLSSYTLIHASAILFKEDKILLKNWAEFAIDSVNKRN